MSGDRYRLGRCCRLAAFVLALAAAVGMVIAAGIPALAYVRYYYGTKLRPTVGAARIASHAFAISPGGPMQAPETMQAFSVQGDESQEWLTDLPWIGAGQFDRDGGWTIVSTSLGGTRYRTVGSNAVDFTAQPDSLGLLTMFVFNDPLLIVSHGESVALLTMRDMLSLHSRGGNIVWSLDLLPETPTLLALFPHDVVAHDDISHSIALLGNTQEIAVIDTDSGRVRTRIPRTLETLATVVHGTNGHPPLIALLSGYGTRVDFFGMDGAFVHRHALDAPEVRGLGFRAFRLRDGRVRLLLIPGEDLAEFTYLLAPPEDSDATRATPERDPRDNTLLARFSDDFPGMHDVRSHLLRHEHPTLPVGRFGFLSRLSPRIWVLISPDGDHVQTLYLATGPVFGTTIGPLGWDEVTESLVVPMWMYDPFAVALVRIPLRDE